MLIIKILLLIALGFITYQDVKDRQIYWFLLPFVGLCAGLIHFVSTLKELFLTSVIVNLIFVSILLLVVLLYTKFKLKTSFKNALGLGDVLFYFAIAFSFSTISFIVIFISALIFSLVLHLTLKSKHKTVPLAGYMSFFFGLTYLSFWFGVIKSVYQI